MMRIMNIVVTAPTAVPTQEVSLPIDPTDCFNRPLMSDVPGISPCDDSQPVTLPACVSSVERSWVTCCVISTPVR